MNNNPLNAISNDNHHRQDVETIRIDDDNNNNNDSNEINLRKYLLQDHDNNKFLLLFLTIIGYYIPQNNDTNTKKILARTWQIILLLLGGVGLIWHGFIFGISHIAKIKNLYDGDSVASGIFFHIVLLFFTLIVPLSQVFSLIYGLHVYAKRKLDQNIDKKIIQDLLSQRINCTVIFFIIMSLIVIIIQPCGFSHKMYEADFADYDDNNLKEIGVQTFSLYVLHEFFVLFYNFAITCYLTTLILFTSLTLHEIKLRQERILEKTKSNTITFQSYKDEKKEITKLNNDSFWTIQIVTITAGLNAIIFVLMMWYWHYFYVITDDTFTYKDMIFFDFKLAPFLLKGIDKYLYFQNY